MNGLKEGFEMAIEKVRLVEALELDKDGSRVAEIMAGEEFPQLHMKDRHWYVISTGEPVSFANKEEASRYLRGQLKVGDYVELDHWDSVRGYISGISNETVSVKNVQKKRAGWNFTPEYGFDGINYVIDCMKTWRNV
jgi:hypothetical protein